MCCYSDPERKRSFLRELAKQGRKTFVAYKIIYDNGEAIYGNQRYKPGVNRANKLSKKYDLRYPTGIHVYMWNPVGPFEGQRIIKVICHVDDLIRMNNYENRKVCQAVLKKIKIRKTDWLQAFSG